MSIAAVVRPGDIISRIDSLAPCMSMPSCMATKPRPSASYTADIELVSEGVWSEGLGNVADFANFA